MDATAILRKRQAAREFWLSLDDGRKVKLRRVGEAEVVKGETTLAQVASRAVDWEGITEAFLIGPAGASDPVPFHEALWHDLLVDDAALYLKVVEALNDAKVRHAQEKERMLGN